MKTRSISAGLITLSLTFAATLWAADTATTTTAPADTQAATSTAPAALASNDAAAIAAAGDKTVAVTGKVDKVVTIGSGITFIDFAGNQRGDFVAIIKKDNIDAVNKGFDGDVAKALKGKKITVTGKITKYHDTPQLEVTKPEQVTIVKE